MKRDTRNEPQPCLACHGSGMFAKGCQLFPCVECKGNGIRPEDDQEKPDPGSSALSS